MPKASEKDPKETLRRRLHHIGSGAAADVEIWEDFLTRRMQREGLIEIIQLPRGEQMRNTYVLTDLGRARRDELDAAYKQARRAPKIEADVRPAVVDKTPETKPSKPQVTKPQVTKPQITLDIDLVDEPLVVRALREHVRNTRIRSEHWKAGSDTREHLLKEAERVARIADRIAALGSDLACRTKT